MDVESTSAAAPSQGAAARRPIGEFLVERGLVTEEQLKQALAEQRSSGKRLGEILVERGAITRMALASVLGEQWEEAGRHLRAVVPVRLAGGKEADAGLAGGEELTDSLASLQAAVIRLEELSGGPGAERVVVGDEAIEASLAGLARQLAELREAVAAPVVVETDHLGDQLAELDTFLRGRGDEPTARVEAAVESLGSRVDAWLRESRVEPPAAIDPEVAERLGRVEALLTERAEAADAVSPELARRLDEIEAAAKRERPTVDLTPIEQRLEALDASLAEALTAPVAEVPTDALVARLEVLERSLGAVRAAVEAPREDPFGEALLARFGGVEEAIGARDQAWEAAGERLGRLEDSVREALGRPAEGAVAGEELVGRLEELRHLVAGLDGSADAARSAELAERFGSLEQRLDALRSAVESPRDDGVAERLGRLEDAVREALGRPGVDELLGVDLVGRLEALQAVVAGLEGSAGAARSAELAEGFGALEHSLEALRAALESSHDDGVVELLASVAQMLGARDLAWEAAAERLSRLEDSVREAVARPEEHGVAELLARLEEVRSAVDARSESGRLESIERSLHELRSLVESPRDDGVAERLAGLEHAIRESTGPHEDARLDETLARLDAVQGELAAARERGLDLDGVRAALAENFAELRAAVEQPRDGALHERLDALEPIRSALDELRSTALEPVDTRGLEELIARSHHEITERIGGLEQAIASEPPSDTDTAAELAERDARIAELVQQLNDRPAADATAGSDRPRPGDTTSFLALVPASDGYRLVALDGTLPAAGEGLAVPDDDRALVVARLGRSPYPGDARPCAYLQAS